MSHTESAFPMLESSTTFENRHGEQVSSHTSTSGLTKRELFAAMAMQGMLADESGGEGNSYGTAACATRAVNFADALLAALSDETRVQE